MNIRVVRVLEGLHTQNLVSSVLGDVVSEASDDDFTKSIGLSLGLRMVCLRCQTIDAPVFASKCEKFVHKLRSGFCPEIRRNAK